jgi:hypothetical protein
MRGDGSSAVKSMMTEEQLFDSFSGVRTHRKILTESKSSCYGYEQHLSINDYFSGQKGRGGEAKMSSAQATTAKSAISSSSAKHLW